MSSTERLFPPDTTSEDALISPAGRAHLRWALTSGVGPVLFTRIMARFDDDAERAWNASRADLEAVEGIGRSTADKICGTRDQITGEREIEAAVEAGVRILSRADDDYPPGLRKIPDAPIVLYVRGSFTPRDTVAVAIVGSRRCTIYGSEQARRFGELLAAAGITVVSGLARGIDAFAHHGALDARGRTIAVLGSGLTEIYPPENRALADRILSEQAGAWVSELPLKTAVRAENFPSRNRIIAGMSLGTIVVEAADRSGALITARLASEYNREVFAVPGRLGEPMSQGTNRLIRDGGAKLITNLEDVLAELGSLGDALRRDASATTPGPDPAAPPAPLPDLSASEAALFAAISAEPQRQDEVVRVASVPIGEALAALTGLELKGLITRLPGQQVQRTRRASD